MEARQERLHQRGPPQFAKGRGGDVAGQLAPRDSPPLTFVLVTGNTRGLGRALSDELVRLGHQVVGCGSAQVQAESYASVAQFAGEVLERHGPPDVLVNNAGIVHGPNRLWEIDEHEFSRVIDVNLKGPYHFLRAFLPAMLERGTGILVNMSSGWGRSTSPRVAPYCATKWGLEGLTRSLAQELPKTMAAVTLDPGTIDTDMLRQAFGNAARHYPKPVDWARLAAPLILGLTARNNGQALSVPKPDSAAP